MNLADFRALVQRLQRDIPREFEGGVVDIEVSPKTVPHPVYPEVYTLGECIPLEWSGNGADLQSRIALYHGSFQALSQLDDSFDWRKEAWETLTHELRHHLEWRANALGLERYDWAAEQNFARHEGRPFDPAFYHAGDRLADYAFKVDDDVFIEAGAEFQWPGRRYRVPVDDVERPAFLTLEGLAEPPPGEAVLVLLKPFGLRDLWRAPQLTQLVVEVEAMDG